MPPKNVFKVATYILSFNSTLNLASLVKIVAVYLLNHSLLYLTDAISFFASSKVISVVVSCFVSTIFLIIAFLATLSSIS